MTFLFGEDDTKGREREQEEEKVLRLRRWSLI
jgi:hypothetical protein